MRKIIWKDEAEYGAELVSALRQIAEELTILNDILNEAKKEAGEK